MTEHLPTHPLTGLTALGLRRDGRPIWPVLGGDGTGDPAPADPAPDTDPPDPAPADDPAAKLDDPGKRALAAEREARKAADAARKAAEKELASLRKADEDRKLAEKSEIEQTQAKLAAAEKKAAEAAMRQVRAEVKASAVGWADPGDAPRYLDDLASYVNDNGEVDAERIATDLAAVLDAKPHLKSAAAEVKPKVPQPDPSQGPRNSTPPRAKSLSEAVSQAYKPK